MDEGLNFSDIFDDSIPYEVKPPEMLTPMEEDDFPTQTKDKFGGLWETELLTETHLQDLYHATSENQLLGMLEDNAVKLAFVGGTQADEFYNKGYPFFLSTMRQKYGNYAHDIGGEYIGNKYNVIVALDGSALSAAGYKHFPIDYWSHGPQYSEQEERIVSNKDEIRPLKKFVKGVHVYIPKDLKHSFTIDTLHKISDLALKIGVKVYFYQAKDLGYFRAHRTERSVRDVDLILPPAQFSSEDLEHLEWRKKNKNTSRESYLDSFIRIYKGDYSKTDKYPDENLLRMMWWHEHDLYPALFAAAHNDKPYHLPIFREIVKAMKKEGVKNFKDLITLVMHREQERAKRENDVKEINEVEMAIPTGEPNKQSRAVGHTRADCIFTLYGGGLIVGMKELPNKMEFFSNSDPVTDALNIFDFQKFIPPGEDRDLQLTHSHLMRLTQSAVRRSKILPVEVARKGEVAGRVWKFDNSTVIGFWQSINEVRSHWKQITWILDKLQIDWKTAEYTFNNKIFRKYTYQDIVGKTQVPSVNKNELELMKLLHTSPQIKKKLIGMQSDQLKDYADRVNIPLIKLKQMLGSMDETAA